MTDPSGLDDQPPAGHPASEPIDTRLVRQLADILTETGLTTIEVEQGSLRIRVKREIGATLASVAPTRAEPALTGAAPGEPPLRETAPEAASVSPSGHVVKSPMVGTVYLQPQPGSPAFVGIGETVKEGQTLCIIEAMKTMNPIPATRAGVLKAFIVGDGQPVEYGEPLAVIE